MSLRILIESPLLEKPCSRIKGVDEGKNILKKLWNVLSKTPNAVGLAAPQIGIPKRACVVKSEKGTLELINPVILDQSGIIIFEEGCLSYPGKSVITERSRNIVVQCDNYNRPLYLDASTNSSFLEVVCVQHEIDHLNGKTMFDRKTNRSDIMGFADL